MSKHVERIRAAAEELISAIATARASAASARAEAAERERRTIAGVEERVEGELVAVRAHYDSQVDLTAADLGELDRLGLPVAPWDDSWREWQPQPAPPAFVRLGMLKAPGKYATVTTQALLPFVNGRNVVFKADGAAKDTAVRGIQSLALRLLALVPPSKLRLLMLDPVGLGENVALFMNLKKHGAELIGGKAWVERADIERQLADLSAHMENVIQGFLRGRFATMEEFNAEAGEVSEAYRLLIVMNFPANFSEEAARRLVSIVHNGPRCGVYTVMSFDTAQRLPHGFDAAELERNAHVFTARPDGTFEWNDPDFAGWRVTLDAPPAVDEFTSLLDRIGRAAREGSVVETPFARMAPAQEEWWSANAAEGVSVPVGRKGAREDQAFGLGIGTAQHALVAGRTGSGKTTLLHVLITGLALTYSPDDLELYLIDFKKGVGFKPYADYALPHARVIAIESEREFGLSVLRGLDEEMKKRGEKFRRYTADTLADYRRKAGQPDGAEGAMPRIVLLVDEFQEFFTEDDSLAREASLLLDRLARQGRAFGMHVLLGSQTLAGTYMLSRSTLDQMAVRVALQCSEADSQLILAKDNPAARLLSRPGDAIYNAVNGLKEGNERFQIAWIEDPVRDRYLRELRDMADQRGHAGKRPVVFEGNAPAHLGEGSEHPLVKALEQPSYPPRSPRVHAWLGEPVALRDPTAATFFRRGGRNLLVVGRDEEQGLGLLAAAVVTLAVQLAPGRVRFLLADYGMDALEGSGFARPVADALPHEAVILGPRDLPSILTELTALVASRLEAPDGGPSVYLVLGGLQRARTLRREEGGYRRSDAPASPGDQLLAVLRDGPEVGVHVLAWADTMTSITGMLDRKALGEFGMRVALSMPDKESSELIGSPAAARLKPFRALLLDEERPGGMETFRPYERPSAEWLAGLGTRLRTREHV